MNGAPKDPATASSALGAYDILEYMLSRFASELNTQGRGLFRLIPWLIHPNWSWITFARSLLAVVTLCFQATKDIGVVLHFPFDSRLIQ
jgi:hypothetical protein